MVQISGTIAFFKAMAPVLANVLTVTFVYCFAKISRKELKGEDEGRLTYLWLIILVFLFMLYGLHTWGVSAASNCCSSGGWEKAAQVRPMRCIRAFEAIDRPGHSNVSLPLKSGSSNQTQLGPVMTHNGHSCEVRRIFSEIERRQVRDCLLDVCLKKAGATDPGLSLRCGLTPSWTSPSCS